MRLMAVLAIKIVAVAIELNLRRWHGQQKSVWRY
jgi:hypothetical protein